MNKAAIYCRVNDQEREGTSLQTQMESCLNYCHENGYEVSHRFSEAYSDGDSPFEGGFLSNQHLKEMVFDDDGRDITSSLIGTPLITSVFRLRPNAIR